MKYTLIALIAVATLFGCNSPDTTKQQINQLQEKLANDTTQANFKIKMANLNPDYTPEELDSLCAYNDATHERKYPNYKPYRIKHAPVDTTSLQGLMK